MIPMKESLEIQAILFLKYLWKGYQPGFIKNESPDWQNQIHDMGVEITQALTQEEGDIRSFWNENRGKNKSALNKRKLMKYQNSFAAKNKKFASMTLRQLRDLHNENSTLEKTKTAFAKKIKKLNGNYSIFRCNCLFIYENAGMRPQNEVQRIAAAIKQIQDSGSYANKFQTVFLKYFDTLFTLDLCQDTIEAIAIENPVAIALNADAEKLYPLIIGTKRSIDTLIEKTNRN